jgi:hypothetical protein
MNWNDFPWVIFVSVALGALSYGVLDLYGRVWRLGRQQSMTPRDNEPGQPPGYRNASEDEPERRGDAGPRRTSS